MQGKFMISLTEIPLVLQTVRMCITCHECFELDERVCPACGSEAPVATGRVMSVTTLN
jgi:rRNA maturation endonuclease Nob1